MTDRRNEHEDFIKERRTGNDRRAHQRHSVSITMELTAGNDLYFHMSGNLSPGGAFFNRAIPHPIGTVVSISFQIPGEKWGPVRCSGQVVNVPEEPDGLGMGVRFLDLTESDRKRIENFVLRVSEDESGDETKDETQDETKDENKEIDSLDQSSDDEGTSEEKGD